MRRGRYCPPIVFAIAVAKTQQNASNFMFPTPVLYSTAALVSILLSGCTLPIAQRTYPFNHPAAEAAQSGVVSTPPSALDNYWRPEQSSPPTMEEHGHEHHR